MGYACSLTMQPFALHLFAILDSLHALPPTRSPPENGPQNPPLGCCACPALSCSNRKGVRYTFSQLIIVKVRLLLGCRGAGLLARIFPTRFWPQARPPHASCSVRPLLFDAQI